jgi:hypothetical protein
MTLDERIEAAAKAIEDALVDGGFREAACAAIAAFQKGAPVVDVPFPREYITEGFLTQIPIMHRYEMREGTYCLTEKVDD